MSTTRIVVSSLLVAVTTLFVTSAVAQEVRLTVRDYVTQPCRPYSPDDPCQRSKWFRLQTGHFGYAYNCDGEECKRNSPYIYWTAPTNHPIPPRHRWLKEARCDLREALGRIADGSCAQCETGCNHCGGSGCSLCQQTRSAEVPAADDDQSVRVAGQSEQQSPSDAGRVSLAELFGTRGSTNRTAADPHNRANSIRTASASTTDDLRQRYPRASQIGRSESAARPAAETVTESAAEPAVKRVNPIAPSRQRLFR